METVLYPKFLARRHQNEHLPSARSMADMGNLAVWFKRPVVELNCPGPILREYPPRPRGPCLRVVTKVKIYPLRKMENLPSGLETPLLKYTPLGKQNASPDP